VPISLAWRFMTDIRNWNDPPAEFGLDGPFVPGAQGWTRMPGQPVHAWAIRDVEPERGYTIEGGSFLEGAVVLVHWRFDALSPHRTRLTQRMELWGEHAERYIDDLRAAFEPNFEPGLQRIAKLMAQAAGDATRDTV
jgi:hypothetical protein